MNVVTTLMIIIVVIILRLQVMWCDGVIIVLAY